MTEKKDKKLFIRYAMFTDFFLSMVFFLTWSAIQLLGTFYLTFMHVTIAIKWAPVILVALFLIVRRLRITNALMLTLHFAVAIGFVIGGFFIFSYDISALIHFAFAAAGNFAYSMSLRYKIRDNSLERVDYDVLIISSIIHIIVFFFLAIRREADYMSDITLSIVLAAMFYFAARQLSVFENNYYHNLHSSTQPVGNIRKQNYLTIAMVMGGIIFSLVLLKVIPVDKIGEIMLLGISFLIRLILSLMPSDADMSGGDNEPLYDEDMLPPVEENTNPVVQFIMTVMAVIIVLGVALAAFYLIIVWIRNLFRGFTHAEDHEVVTGDNAVTDIVESIKPGKARLKRRDFGKGTEREIRKKFYLKMRKGIADGLPIKSSSSPQQIRTMLKDKGDDTIDELTKRYEEIRYR